MAGWSAVGVTRGLLAGCAVATLGIGIHMAQPWGDNYAYQGARAYLQLAAMLLWAIAPYVALALGARLFRTSGRARLACCIGAIVIGLAGVYAYVDTAFIHPDAQGGLSFIAVPVLQWIAVLGLWAACAAMHWLGRRTG